MKTNPWMIVSLVLSCVCGFLVGVLVSNPGVVSAEPKHDWEYSTNYSMGKLIATRWDKNAEAPLPEMMILAMGGDYKDVDLDEVLASPGKWCETVLLDDVGRFTRGLDAEIERAEAELERTRAEIDALDGASETSTEPEDEENARDFESAAIRKANEERIKAGLGDWLTDEEFETLLNLRGKDLELSDIEKEQLRQINRAQREREQNRVKREKQNQ